MLTDEIDELLKQDKGIGYHQCPIGKILSDFEGEDRSAIIRLVDKSQVTAPKIASYFATKGYSLNSAKISKHRRRLAGNGSGCSCPVEM